MCCQIVGFQLYYLLYFNFKIVYFTLLYLSLCVIYYIAISRNTCKFYNIEPSIWRVGKFPQQLLAMWGQINRVRIEHSRLNGHLMLENDHHPMCRHTEYRNQKLTIKHCLKECKQKRNSRRKYNIPNDVKELLGEDCKVGKFINFLNDTGLFEII